MIGYSGAFWVSRDIPDTLASFRIIPLSGNDMHDSASYGTMIA